MPYSGPSDDSLPANVQKMPEHKRRAFVHAFNSAYADRRDGEDAKKRESRAFAVANAAANRAGEKSMAETAVGVKHDSGVVPVEIVADYSQPLAEYVSPYENLTSFAALEALNDAQRSSSALAMVFSNFEMLAHNILRNEALSAGQKSSALTALTSELDTHLAAAREDPESAYKDTEQAATDPSDGTVVAFKDASGAYRWLTVHTNKFRDKTGEIFEDAAHKEYVEWANSEKGFLPVLRFWHAPKGMPPGSKFDLGQADALGYDDNGFVVASGTFYDHMQDVAERLAGAKDLGCSHGYLYRVGDKQNGVFKRYRSFEVSILPRPFEANQLTLSGVGEEGSMLGAKQREAFVTYLGEDRTKAIEDQMTGLRALAETTGIDYKDVAASLVEPEAPVEATLVTPEVQAQIDAAVRRALAERDAAAVVPEPVAEAAVEGAPAPDPEPVATTVTTAPVAATVETPGVTITQDATPAGDEGSEPVPAGEAMSVPAALPSDTKALDPMAGVLAAMQTMVDTAIANAMAPVAAAVKALDDRVAVTEVGVDAKVAERMRPKPMGPIATEPASTSPATALPPAYAAAFRADVKGAEITETERPEGAPLDLVGRYGLAATLSNAALMGGDAD